MSRRYLKHHNYSGCTAINIASTHLNCGGEFFEVIHRCRRVSACHGVHYILGEIRTGSPNDETLWLPNKEMTKPCEVSDETSTNLFPHF